MFKKLTINEVTSKQYLNPGKNLNDLELVRLYNSLISINMNAKAQVDNLFLKQGLKLAELRETFSTCAITLLEDRTSLFGFLISPIIQSKSGHIFHAGLIIFNRNPGGDYLSLAALCNSTMVYEKYGEVYATNISSTPSIIEVFSKTFGKVWPSPKANLKRPPNGYKIIVHELKSQYMDKYFPDDSNVVINNKRFTMSSNSNDMGFSTNYYELSRAENYSYQVFCSIWLNYQESEDIIQVGKIDLKSYIIQKIKLSLLKIKLSRIKATKEKGSQAQKHIEKKVA